MHGKATSRGWWWVPTPIGIIIDLSAFRNSHVLFVVEQTVKVVAWKKKTKKKRGPRTIGFYTTIVKKTISPHTNG